MSPRFAVCAALATYVLAVGNSAAWAESVSVNPVADAFVFSGEPGSNYGGGGVFAVSAPGLPDGEFQSLVRFDLSGAKSSFDLVFGQANWILTSAVLQLSAASPNNSIFNTSNAGQFNARWMQNDSWTEGSGAPTSPGDSGITWNSLPMFLSANDQDVGTFSFDGSTNATASYLLAVSPGLVDDAIAGGLASFRLSAASGDATMSGAFNSRSFNAAVRHPVLTLNAVAVPEPATWILAVCGVVAFGLLRRRRRLE